MSSPVVVPSLPPTYGISDPHVRAFCDAMASAWSVRNGGVGKDDDRFVRRGEIDGLASQVIADVLSGAASAGVSALQPGSTSSAYNDILSAIERLVTGSAAYEYLRTPIKLIDVPKSSSVGISSEASTRSNKDNYLAQAINTIWASIGGSAALIQDSALAAVSPAAVSATKWTQVQAAVTDPNTGQVSSSSIKEDLLAYASLVDGSMNTTWSVRSNINGVISGLVLMTTAGAGSDPSTPTSHFMVMADRFSLVSPDNEALRPVPFSVDSFGNAVFAGNLYAAGGTFGGTLTAANGTFTGSLSAAKIAVGLGGAAVTFFDPLQPTVPLRSSPSSTLTYSGDPGLSVVTGAAVDFRNNDTGVSIERRIRTGLVTFNLMATATVDHFLSLWYRRNGGAWVFIYTAAEAGGTYGTGAAGYSLQLSIAANDTIEFGMNVTDSAGVPNNYGLTQMLFAQLTVTARNF